jgi:hypothetical protein
MHAQRSALSTGATVTELVKSGTSDHSFFQLRGKGQDGANAPMRHIASAYLIQSSTTTTVARVRVKQKMFVSRPRGYPYSN